VALNTIALATLIVGLTIGIVVGVSVTCYLVLSILFPVNQAVIFRVIRSAKYSIINTCTSQYNCLMGNKYTKWSN